MAGGGGVGRGGGGWANRRMMKRIVPELSVLTIEGECWASQPCCPLRRRPIWLFFVSFSTYVSFSFLLCGLLFLYSFVCFILLFFIREYSSTLFFPSFFANVHFFVLFFLLQFLLVSLPSLGPSYFLFLRSFLPSRYSFLLTFLLTFFLCSSLPPFLPSFLLPPKSPEVTLWGWRGYKPSINTLIN